MSQAGARLKTRGLVFSHLRTQLRRRIRECIEQGEESSNVPNGDMGGTHLCPPPCFKHLNFRLFSPYFMELRILLPLGCERE